MHSLLRSESKNLISILIILTTLVKIQTKHKYIRYNKNKNNDLWIKVKLIKSRPIMLPNTI